MAAAKAEMGNRNQRPRDGNIWTVPESERVKCNIGISWSKAMCMAGLGWIVRNSEGETLLHSRRAINGVSSLLEARRLGLIWAAESMNSHKLQKVCFELEDYELVGSVNKPKAWPAFWAYGEKLRDALNKVKDWKVSSVKIVANKAAFMIARSVTKERRYQSYVAQGSPSWLRSLLAEEDTRSIRV